MRALLLNCTLKASPEASNTEALAAVVVDALEADGVTTSAIRVVDHDVKPGVENDMGDGDAWPAIREQLLASEILVFASPTWLGRPSSLAQRVLERMDARVDLLEPGPRPGGQLPERRPG
jgi:multimeric flavodoxin WrbA